MKTNPFIHLWRLSDPGLPLERVAWLQEQPLSFIGSWEPLSFRRRAGYAYTDEAEFMREEEFSDAALDSYVKAGANSLIIPFGKGFGFSAAKNEIAEEKDLVERAHRKGLKVATYIRVDTVIPELVKHDCPDVEQWLSVGMYERRALYSDQQSFRQQICLLHPSAIRWTESLFAYASNEMKADMLHLDGFSVATYPWDACRCARCLATYRSWLKSEFADENRREQVFGLVDFDRIEFPSFEPRAPLPTVLSSPDMQTWYRYQWDKNLAFTRHVRRCIREINPDMAVSVNFWWSRAANLKRIACQYSEQIFPWVDAVWTEDRFHLDYVKGKIRSRAGMFKTAREYSIPVCHYHWAPKPDQIEASLALSLAGNAGNPSCLGFSFRYLPHYSLGLEAKQRFTAWAKQNWEVLGHTRPTAEIALIRHHPSLAWNARAPWLSAMSLEQLLIGMKVPWRMFDHITADTLEQVRTVLLADAESLSNDEVTILKTWVANGGRLFFTARTGTHDEHRRRRPANVILDWVKNRADAPNPPPGPTEWFEWYKEDFTEFDLEESDTSGQHAAHYRFGQGTLGYWPTIHVEFKGCTANQFIKPEELRTPDQSDAIEAFIRQLHGPFSFTVKGPPSLLVECSRQPATGEMLLHLIHTEAGAAPIDVEVVRTQGIWAQPRLLTPDLKPPKIALEGKTIQVIQVQRYAVLAVAA
jgi:hypothetical protein